MLDKLAVIGYSGHSYVVIEAAKKSGLNIFGYFEQSERPYNPYNLKYLGNEIEFDKSSLEGLSFILAIGENKLRFQITEQLKNNNWKYSNVIHPISNVSNSISMGVGNFINVNANINALVNIGNHSIINTGAIVEHECRIGNYVHIGPGAVLAGNVTIGDGSFIGANSVIKQGVKIGKNVIVGAGSVVLKDIVDNEIEAGNPSRKIK